MGRSTKMCHWKALVAIVTVFDYFGGLMFKDGYFGWTAKNSESHRGWIKTWGHGVANARAQGQFMKLDPYNIPQ